MNSGSPHFFGCHQPSNLSFSWEFVRLGRAMRRCRTMSLHAPRQPHHLPQPTDSFATFLRLGIHESSLVFLFCLLRLISSLGVRTLNSCYCTSGTEALESRHCFMTACMLFRPNIAHPLHHNHEVRWNSSAQFRSVGVPAAMPFPLAGRRGLKGASACHLQL